MRKLFIVLDMDGVLVHTDPLFILFCEKKLEVKLGKIKKHEEILAKADITFAKLYYLFDLFASQGGWIRLEAEKKCYEVLSRLNIINDAELFISTARNNIYRAETCEWIRRELPFIKDDNIFLTNYENFKPLETKAQLFKRLGANVFIEDNFSHALSVAETNSDVLVLLHRRPQNMDLSDTYLLERNIIPVENWNNISTEIEKFRVS